jgi:hypothetical protein
MCLRLMAALPGSVRNLLIGIVVDEIWHVNPRLQSSRICLLPRTADLSNSLRVLSARDVAAVSLLPYVIVAYP